MSGWYCVRSGPGRGCYPLPDPRTVTEQLELELHVDEEPDAHPDQARERVE